MVAYRKSGAALALMCLLNCACVLAHESCLSTTVDSLAESKAEIEELEAKAGKYNAVGKKLLIGSGVGLGVAAASAAGGAITLAVMHAMASNDVDKFTEEMKIPTFTPYLTATAAIVILANVLAASLGTSAVLMGAGVAGKTAGLIKKQKAKHRRNKLNEKLDILDGIQKSE
eukprot:GHVT01028574.1.p1 GENE.GHVT01028574.1~~GHVT01028574.1.p1  ORF type:complete len:172 (-),score=30.62 GHVT01028574.1:1012-1527(-)